jgi:hypothetical protein
MRFFHHKKGDDTPVKLSEQALLFVKKYAIPELKIQKQIDFDIAMDILDFACQCELNMIDDQGYDRTDNYSEKERDLLGDAYVTETCAYVIDLDDLNKRLGLL